MKKKSEIRVKYYADKKEGEGARGPFGFGESKDFPGKDIYIPAWEVKKAGSSTALSGQLLTGDVIQTEGKGCGLRAVNIAMFGMA